MKWYLLLSYFCSYNQFVFTFCYEIDILVLFITGLSYQSKVVASAKKACYFGEVCSSNKKQEMGLFILV